jgi:hypothetical protein
LDLRLFLADQFSDASLLGCIEGPIGALFENIPEPPPCRSVLALNWAERTLMLESARLELGKKVTKQSGEISLVGLKKACDSYFCYGNVKFII